MHAYMFCVALVILSGPYLSNGFLQTEERSKTPVVCYFWQGKGEQPPNKLETGLCSHIIVGFAGLTKDGQVDATSLLDNLKQAVAIKNSQPDLKVMLTLGGGGGTHGFSQAVQTSENRRKLSQSILDLIQEINLDGIDLDWEFPGWNTPSIDKANFALFVQDLRKVLKDSNANLLLSVAVANKQPIITASYNVEVLSKYADFINLMAYDFHGYHKFEDPFTGFNSPLFARKLEIAYFSTLNTAWTANYWVKIGMPRNKIMVGIPTYAITYELADPNLSGVDAPAVGGGKQWSYSMVCDFIKSGATTYFDNESLVPYAVKGNQWISYENERSVIEKVKWIKSEQFGGVMTYRLNADDVTGKCGSRTYPLHKAINDELNK